MKSFGSVRRASVFTVASTCVLLLALVGCDDDNDHMDAGLDAAPPTMDSGPRPDGAVGDGGEVDGGAVDGGAVDGGGEDGGAMDGGGADGGGDAAMGDAGPVGGGAATSAQIQAVRDAAAGPADLMIEGAIVTYLKPMIGDDVAGFFLQAQQMGPAVFVAVDPTSLTPPAAVGQVVDLRATDLTDVGDLRQITAIDPASWMVESSGHDVRFLVQNVTDEDVVTMLDQFESELITVEARPRGVFRFAGNGFQQISIDTTGVGDSDAYVLRVPDALASTLDLEAGCNYVVTGTPLWRFNDTAQVSAFDATEVTRGTCDMPVVLLASATNERTVVVRFNRAIDPASVMADGSQLTITDEASNPVAVTGAMAAPDQDYLIVTTGADLAGDMFYTVSVDATVTDTAGTGVDPTMNSDTFDGYTPHLVINEIDYDQPSTDDGEFVEIFNPGLTAVPLSGVTLYTINGESGTTVNTMVDLGTNSEALTELAAGAYLVVLTSGSSSVTVPTGVATVELDEALQNGLEGVVLTSGGAGGCQDAVFYEGIPSAASFMGCSYESGTGSDDGSADSLARIPNGADSQNNSVDFRLVAPTPGAANVP